MTELRAMYRTLERDVFPDTMSMTFGDMTVHYNKVTWEVDGEKKGLRYGDNPGQPSALYRPVNGNLVLAGLEFIGPGKGLVTELELLRSGKHPGNINLMDVDGALGILRFFTHTPTVAIMKHNNPCGVASRPTLREAYREANMADRVAAFGGAVAFNRAVDRDTAKEVMRSYSEVVVAPDYEEGVVDILEKRKDLRILRIGGMDRLHNWRDEVFPEIRSLCDGGIIVQTSYLPMIRTLEDIRREGVVPGDVPVRRSEGDRRVDTGGTVSIRRQPTEDEYRDMLFGWLVESGITSNSVIFVKDRVTVGIGTGEQDRVGVAEIARDKAYTKLRDRLSFERYGIPYNVLLLRHEKETKEDEKDRLSQMMESIEEEVRERRGGLRGAVMVSDGFFPFRDGADVGLREGVTAIIQPGGSMRDHDTVVACNERNATMIFTGQRSFRH